MRRAKRILVIAGILVLGVGSADAKLWGRKTQKPAAAPPVASAMALTSVEIDGSRVVLRTSGAPAYTSYSPTPGVFVVDLTGTSRDAAVSIPASLPSSVISVSADEVVEMGTQLTRVTFRLSEPLQPEVSAADKAVVVTLPAAAVLEASSIEALPTVTATPEPAVAEQPAPASLPGIEILAEPVAEVAEPIARTEEISLPRARTVKRIEAKSTDGTVEVRVSADGALKYKAFRLESPSRLVIDLEGVKNAVAKSNVAVDDEVVKRVRVAQFQVTPTPVARVVIDLAHKAEYEIGVDGNQLRVAFGPNSGALLARKSDPEPQPKPAETVPAVASLTVSEPAPAPPTTPRREMKPVPVDIPSQVPAIAENAATWKMPEPASKGARQVINAPEDQAPPATEDVFSNQPAITNAPQTLSGTRQLSAGQRVFNGEPISLNLKDADLKDVLRTFAELTGLNIAVDPGVNGSVTVDFVDVPWDQALDIILRQNNLTFVLEGNVMRIGTIDRLAAETAATRRLAEEERLNVPLTTVSYKLSYARAPEVASLLAGMASPRAKIIVDQRTNQLIISEIPGYLQTMQNLIQTVDVPTPQVMIEARIVESSRTFAQQWGFDFGFGGDLDPALGTGTGLVFPNRVGFTGGPFNFGAGGNVIELHLFDVLGSFSLDFALAAAESQGYIKVVSAPRVTTQDNTSATITSGFQIPYQTRINLTTTITYLDATLSLAVTPQITTAGTVIMDISVQKNEPAPGLTIIGGAGTPLSTRQARTRLMVRDGGTAVIAGIFQVRDNRAESRLPFVHQIPVIGNLFKSHDISTSHDELLIFITPRIVRG
jgi:type IV pilus assembly protein PilQ